MSLITPDFGLLFWMTLIFALVFFILAKWGFPIITSMVDKRADRIGGSLRKAEEADKALEQLSEKQAAIVEQARQQQAQILRDAAQSSDKIIAKAKEDAAAEAEKILSQARTQIEAEKESALRDLRSQVAGLSVAVAQKILRDNLKDPAAQDSYLNALLDEIDSQKDSKKA